MDMVSTSAKLNDGYNGRPMLDSSKQRHDDIAHNCLPRENCRGNPDNYSHSQARYASNAMEYEDRYDKRSVMHDRFARKRSPPSPHYSTKKNRTRNNSSPEHLCTRTPSPHKNHRLRTPSPAQVVDKNRPPSYVELHHTKRTDYARISSKNNELDDDEMSRNMLE